ncbi:ribonuclease VapC [Microbacterium sp. W4I4]|uniref:type II toxin-antitoxin system VapC family toxin n=1 Tax=Microbacterium sp. W4I4 TaxID=3042295 RepID=UPI00278589EA|nr:type II toxin-antitoxin system VapC family toxin [Microbacterium sp. W4I4]MDQ0614253.1 ribonuclease VapC [Microbacterium sp. W4I4]
MIVDTSVWMAIIMQEIEAEHFVDLIESRSVTISAGTLVETEIVVHRRRGEPALNELRELLRRVRAEIVSVDERQARIATDAYRRYGRGSGSPARLNYGDCFSYALAIARDEPLLFKGDDFVHTDVRVAAS